MNNIIMYIVITTDNAMCLMIQDLNHLDTED